MTLAASGRSAPFFFLICCRILAAIVELLFELSLLLLNCCSNYRCFAWMLLQYLQLMRHRRVALSGTLLSPAPAEVSGRVAKHENALNVSWRRVGQETALFSAACARRELKRPSILSYARSPLQSCLWRKHGGSSGSKRSTSPGKPTSAAMSSRRMSSSTQVSCRFA